MIGTWLQNPFSLWCLSCKKPVDVGLLQVGKGNGLTFNYMNTFDYMICMVLLRAAAPAADPGEKKRFAGEETTYDLRGSKTLQHHGLPSQPSAHLALWWRSMAPFSLCRKMAICNNWCLIFSACLVALMSFHITETEGAVPCFWPSNERAMCFWEQGRCFLPLERKHHGTEGRMGQEKVTQNCLTCRLKLL